RFTSSSTRSTSSRPASASSASLSLVAVPTSSKPGVAAITEAALRRNAGWSSTTNTLTAEQRGRASSIAGDPEGAVEIQRQHERAEPGLQRAPADVGRVVDEALVVLGVEDRLALSDERLVGIALVELVALLVDGEVVDVDELGDLIEVVLEPDEQPAVVRR